MEEFKKEIDSKTVNIGDFITRLSTKDISSKQKINKNITELNDTLDQMGLTDIYRMFHPEEEKYMFFSNIHGSFSKIDHIVGHKTSLNMFTKIEIISSTFSDHNGLKLETNHKKKSSKTFKYMKVE